MKRVGILILLCSCFGWGQGQTTANITPSSTGQRLGNSSQRWDAFIQNLDVNGTMTLSGPFTIPATAFAGLLSANNGWNGNQTFTGTATLTDARCKGHGCFDVTAYGADATGVVDSSTAFASTVTASGVGGEIRIPPGTYATCNVAITSSALVHGLGAGNWPGVSPSAPTQLQCATSSAFALRAVSASGNTTISHHGPAFENFTIQDMTNAGAGGLGTGGLLIDTVNRYRIRNIAVQGYSGTGSYGIKLNQNTPGAGFDSSYGLIEQPFLKSNYYGIWSRSYQNGTVVLGGEMTNNTVGFYTDPAQTDHDFWNLATSYEMNANNQIAMQLNGAGATADARFETVGSFTGTRGVQVTATGSHNRISGPCIQTEVCFDLQSGSAFNEVDFTASSRASRTKAIVYDAGLSNVIRGAGKGEVWGFDIGGFLGSKHGIWFGRSVTGTSQGFALNGRSGSVLRNSPTTAQQVGATAMSRDASGNVTITFDTTFNTAIGQSVVIDTSGDSTFDTNNCVVTAKPDSTHLTCLPATPVLSAATSGYAFVYTAAGLNLSSPDGLNTVVGHGMEQVSSATSSTQNAASTTAEACVYGAGSITCYTDTGLTPGTTFTRTLRFTLTATAATFVPQIVATAGVVPATAGGAALGDSTHTWSGIQIGSDSTNRVNMTASGITAARAVVWRDIGTNDTPTHNIAKGTAAMTTAAITAGNCGTTVTVAATGVLTTDVIEWSFNAAPAGGNAGVVSWPTTGNVNFAYCPNTAETPAAATLNWKVVR